MFSKLNARDIMIDFAAKFDVERLGLYNHAKRSPGKPALIMNDTVITFKELDRMTNALANAFLQHGVRHGDRISTLFHNSPEILEVWGAA